MTTRVVVVDSNPILRLGLKELLKSSANILIVGEASRCSDGCRAISALRPDLVVFDLDLEDACGAQVIERFRERFPELRAVIYTSRQEPEFVAEAVACHIQGFVLKTSPMHRLGEAIQFVAGGLSYLDPTITETVLSQLSRRSREENRPGLSDREIAILRLLAAGKRNKEIAEALHITERTVKFHVSAILRRLEARNRTQAVRIAEDLRLLPRAG
jgi:DNA-binding NarL/FixJ family response regulator